MTTPAARVTLPWAQQIWDHPVPLERRDVLLQAFAPPTPDLGDASHYQPADVVSLAVVLDLLATRLRPLPAGPAILAGAAEHAIAVGLAGGADPQTVCARLLELSQSPTADARAKFVAAFGRELSDMLHPLEPDTTLPPPPPHATTLTAVVQALLRINRATELVVREAELLLAQRRARGNQQI